MAKNIDKSIEDVEAKLNSLHRQWHKLQIEKNRNGQKVENYTPCRTKKVLKTIQYTEHFVDEHTGEVIEITSTKVIAENAYAIDKKTYRIMKFKFEKINHEYI